LEALRQGVGKLLKDPESGVRRDSLREGYRSKLLEHHVVFYTFTDEEVRIRRVLHKVMDMGRHV